MDHKALQDIEPAHKVELNRPLRNSSPVVRFLDFIANLRARFTPSFILDARELFKTQGFRGVVKRYGWKLFACFFLYYLVRDSILYIFIPYMITKGLF